MDNPSMDAPSLDYRPPFSFLFFFEDNDTCVMIRVVEWMIILFFF